MTIGHIYRSLSLGGMQRGAGAILKVHHEMGHKLVVFTREPEDGREYGIGVPFDRIVVGGGSYMKKASEERVANLRKALQAHPCDIVVHHEYFARSLEGDLTLLAEMKIPALVQWHSCFSALHMLDWWNGQVCDQFDVVRRFACGVLAFSRTDCAFFKLIGIPAVRIPYSDPDIFGGAPSHPDGRGCEILWPSRFSAGKRPLHALMIMEHVLTRCPDARITMLGDGPERAKLDDYLASRPSLAARVSLPGFVTDVVPYFRKADVVLMTTEFEGFCHSIMEAKMAALPVVGYELDYLDTARPGTGYVSVPQGDIQAAADMVCGLLEDGAERRRLGALGRRDFEGFASLDQKALYEDAFGMALGGERRETTADEEEVVLFAPDVLKVLLGHVDAHWRNTKEMAAFAEERRRRSFLYRVFARLARCCSGGK